MSGSRRRFLKALGYNALVTSEFLKTVVPAFSLPDQERPGTTQATESITLDPDQITVLMGSDAALLGRLRSDGRVRGPNASGLRTGARLTTRLFGQSTRRKRPSTRVHWWLSIVQKLSSIAQSPPPP